MTNQYHLHGDAFVKDVSILLVLLLRPCLCNGMNGSSLADA